MEGAGERSSEQPQGWEKKAGLECHWRASRFSKPWDLIPEPQLLPAVPCVSSSPLVCKILTLTQPSISVPAITMTRVIRDSYRSAQNRFEAEPLSCTPPPHICRSSSWSCTGTQQLGLLESKDDSSGFRSLQRYIPQPRQLQLAYIPQLETEHGIGARMPGLLPDTLLGETCSVYPGCRSDNAALHPWRTLSACVQGDLSKTYGLPAEAGALSLPCTWLKGR